MNRHSSSRTSRSTRAQRALTAWALLACAFTAQLASAAEPEQDTQRVLVREYDQRLKQVREAYVAQDWERAYRMASETARWGDKWSQFVLGSLHLDGLGGADENVLLAYGWLATAAESGIDDFVTAAQRLREAIPPEHHGEADAAARALTQRYGLEATGVRCDKRRITGSNRRVLDCRKSRSATDEWIVVPAFELEDGGRSLAQQKREQE